jgi:hypothetical protein
VRFDAAGVDRQPLEVRLADDRFAQALPRTVVAPPLVSSARILSVTIIGRKIAPRRAGAQNPAYGIDEKAIIPGNSAPLTALPGQQWLQYFPCRVGYIVPPVCFHRKTSVFVFLIITRIL